MATETLETRLSSHRGVTNGFDYLRLFLATAVMVMHAVSAITLGNNEVMWQSSYQALPRLVVPMFFALSGFLVAASLYRAPDLLTFTSFRALRLMPTLAAEAVLSALLLGPLVTTIPLKDYFSSPEIWSYFGNIAGQMQYVLPGVFTHNPTAGIVNGSLWTIPLEMGCYLALALAGLTGIIRRSRLLLILLLLIIVVQTLHLILPGANPLLYKIGPNEPLLAACFTTGVLFFQYRKYIPYSAALFWGALLLALALLSSATLSYVATPFIAYIMVYLGLSNPPKKMPGDYSYGVYLFASPIQQTVMYLYPVYPYWWFNLLLAVPLTFGCAFLSWHCLESPILARKKEVARTLRQLIDRVAPQDKDWPAAS